MFPQWIFYDFVDKFTDKNKLLNLVEKNCVISCLSEVECEKSHKTLIVIRVIIV